MSERRFTALQGYSDNIPIIFYDNNHEISYSDVLNLLNEFQLTVMQLEKENDEMKERILDTVDVFTGLGFVKERINK